MGGVNKLTECMKEIQDSLSASLGASANFNKRRNLKNWSLLADFIGLIHWCTVNALAYTGGFSHIIVILVKTCIARARLLVL